MEARRRLFAGGPVHPETSDSGELLLIQAENQLSLRAKKTSQRAIFLILGLGPACKFGSTRVPGSLSCRSFLTAFLALPKPQTLGCHDCPGLFVQLSGTSSGTAVRHTSLSGSVAAVCHKLCHGCLSHLSVMGFVAAVCHRFCRRAGWLAVGCDLRVGGKPEIHVN